MKFKYFPDTDTLYIELSSNTSAESQEIADGVVVDYDQSGRIVGLEIDQAQKILDLTQLEIDKLPIEKQKISA